MVAVIMSSKSLTASAGHGLNTVRIDPARRSLSYRNRHKIKEALIRRSVEE